MSVRRQLAMWVLAATGASALLAGVLFWQHKYARARYSSFLAGNPQVGARLFERKGCARCHSMVAGQPGHSGPALSTELRPKSNINQLVAAMWNHAPHMWKRMRSEGIDYPSFSHEETAHLFAFLYTVRYLDEPGDVGQGVALFKSKGCVRCHAVNGQGGSAGPDLGSVFGIDTPILWAQVMWNHAPAMESGMQELGLPWPKFEAREMNDLLAYIRSVSGGPRREWQLLPADPAEGWKVFQEKSCVACHSVKNEGKRVGPDLGPKARLPVTLVQFAGAMWNHSPQMWRAMKAGGIARPTFEDRQMADLIAFLYSLRYFEPGGSPELGRAVFEHRNCNHCHGDQGLGTSRGPALRRPGQSFTTIALAVSLWRHGPKMYQRAQQLSLPWPALAENEVGDLVAFINSPVQEVRR